MSSTLNKSLPSLLIAEIAETDPLFPVTWAIFFFPIGPHVFAETGVRLIFASSKKYLIALYFLATFTISGIVWKKILSANRINYHLIFFRTLFSIGFTLLLILLFKLVGYSNSIWLKPVNLVDFAAWSICIIICLFSFWGLYFFTSALKVGRYSFVGALSTTTSFFSFITAVILYKENPGFEKWLVFFVILLAYVYHQKDSFKGFNFSKEVVFLIFSSTFWGISFVCFLIPIKVFGILYFSLILEICVLFSCVFLLIAKEKRIVPPKIDSKTLFYCSIIGFVICVGSVLSNLSLTQLPVYVNILISLLFEITTIFYNLMKFKEKLFVKDWVLISVVTIGVFLMMV